MQTKEHPKEHGAPACCRLRIDPGNHATLADDGVAILQLEGVHSVAIDARGALQITFAPEVLPVADLVRMLEYAGLISEGIAWSVHPQGTRSSC